MRAYYNEIDAYKCDWLQNSMDAGLITPGVIDDRSIADISAGDLDGFERVHLFAGAGFWDFALNLAGWPAGRAVWTGSCPCPPFSSAGKKKACPGCGGTNPVPCPVRTGFFLCCLCGHAWAADQRHLWPEFWRLVRDARPDVVFGEQVSSEDGRTWLDLVRASLEIMDYRLGHLDACSSGVGSPNIRQRLYWVADAASDRCGQKRTHGQRRVGRDREEGEPARLGAGCVASSLGDPGGTGLSLPEREALEREGRGQEGRATEQPGTAPRRLGDAPSDGQWQPRQSGSRGEQQVTAGGPGVPGDASCRLGDPDGPGAGRHAGADARAEGEGEGERIPARHQERGSGAPDADDRPGPLNGFWRDADWLFCTDGKWRPVEPGAFVLAAGDSGRVRIHRAVEGQEKEHVYSRTGALKGFGDAINVRVAAEFIQAFLEAEADMTVARKPEAREAASA